MWAAGGHEVGHEPGEEAHHRAPLRARGERDADHHQQQQVGDAARQRQLVDHDDLQDLRDQDEGDPEADPLRSHGLELVGPPVSGSVAGVEPGVPPTDGLLWPGDGVAVTVTVTVGAGVGAAGSRMSCLIVLGACTTTATMSIAVKST